MLDSTTERPGCAPWLCERFGSRGEADFADKMPSALRWKFGGHEEKAAAPKGDA